MSYYVAPHQPSYLFLRKNKNERDARYLATQELACLINDKSLGLKLPNGFSTKQLIEIKEEDLMPKNKEEIVTAVETLAKLSDAKQKSQTLYNQALGARKNIEMLFEDKLLTEEDFNEVKKSLKYIKDYAVALSAYKEALAESEKARNYLKEILALSE